MKKLKEDLKLFIESLYSDLDYHIPHTLEWKEWNGSVYLSFRVNSGKSYEEKDHDNIVKTILSSEYRPCIAEVYTVESTRHYQVYLRSIEKIRKMKLKKLLG